MSFPVSVYIVAYRHIESESSGENKPFARPHHRGQESVDPFRQQMRGQLRPGYGQRTLDYRRSDKGEMTVVLPGEELEIVAKNELGERTFASPATSGGCMFLRSEKYLFRIAE